VVDRPVIGLAISTIGRPALTELLESAAASSQPPGAVAIANQSGRPLAIDIDRYPFPVTVVTSSSGASSGRNDALRALPDSVDVVGFPNDDSFYPPASLEVVASRFATDPPPDAVACSDGVGRAARSQLPAAGSVLDRRTAWLAVEWRTFVSRAAWVDVGGFRTDLGTGCRTPWQSGEGTDLLLRIIAGGGQVVSARDITIGGPGERRDLTDDQLVAKHRRYARGTGYVYRVHGYRVRDRLRILAGPWLGMRRFGPGIWLAVRIAIARFIGRIEGLSARCVDIGPGAGSPPPPTG
jgi:hypothetical protein